MKTVALKRENTQLLASIVKEAVVHADRIEITLNTAGFAPLMQEVWNESAKD